MDASWYIILVRSGAEDLLRDSLKERGFVSYFPQYRRERFLRKQRKMVSDLTPLVPGYVFIRALCPRSVPLSLQYARGFLRNGDSSYAILSDKAMTELRQIEQQQLNRPKQEIGVDGQLLSVGDQVTLMEHSLEGEIVVVGKSVVSLKIGSRIIRVSRKGNTIRKAA